MATINGTCRLALGLFLVMILAGELGLSSCSTMGSVSVSSPDDYTRYEKAMTGCTEATKENLASILKEFDAVWNLGKNRYSYKERAAMLHARVYACQLAGNEPERQKSLAMSAEEYAANEHMKKNYRNEFLLAWKQGPGWLLPYPVQVTGLQPPPLVSLPLREALKANSELYEAILAPATNWKLESFGKVETILADAVAFDQMGEKELASLARSSANFDKVLRMSLRLAYLDGGATGEARAKALLVAAGKDPRLLQNTFSKTIAADLLMAAGKPALAQQLVH